MTRILTISATFALVAATAGCIRPEAPNAEADILTASVEGMTLLRPADITNDKVTFYANPWEDLSALKPAFTLTPGAKIMPESGSAQDFTHPVTYTVTSEDGKWTKKYTVSFSMPTNTAKSYYSFDEAKIQKGIIGKYYVFPLFNDEKQETGEWASGNAGFVFTSKKSSDPSTYPTAIEEKGVKGKALKLTTLSTGSLGKGQKKPIAAGSLYLGSFNLGAALSDALKATVFGIPLSKKPAMMRGYYKYTPGEKVTDKDENIVDNAVDSFDIYAVVYEVTDKVKVLDGTNVLSSENLVMVARIDDKDRKPATEWTRFELPFKTLEGKALDADKLAQGKYNYTIVFSSSKDGGKFVGAIGSTLLVDEVEVFFE